MGFPDPHSPWVGATEHRNDMYNSSVSTNRLDTVQMAMIRYTLTSTSVASWLAVPAKLLEAVFGVWPLSTRDTSTVAVAVSAGSPWSFTRTKRRCRGESVSSRARVVLISPVYSPTRKGLRAPPTDVCSSKDNHAL
uniref:Uncharacterized protein n=1 Tax=Urocitellus parryii TaxID=9999 RepID=A0A8D2KFJ5_UROPR